MRERMPDETVKATNCPVSPGLRGFLRWGTSSANAGRVSGKGVGDGPLEIVEKSKRPTQPPAAPHGRGLQPHQAAGLGRKPAEAPVSEASRLLAPP